MAFSLNGIGTTYLGVRWQPDGTYITTKWVVFVWVPIVPLGSVRVIEGDIGSTIPADVGFGSGKVVPVPLDVRTQARLGLGRALIAAEAACAP